MKPNESLSENRERRIKWLLRRAAEQNRKALERLAK